MSRGFRDSDTTQALSEQAIAEAIDKIVHGAEDSEPAPADGRCVDCGGEIGAERLEALPSAVRCVSCQAAWEKAKRP
ncbi:MAG TPA: TraR/DksA C4-type zinc finger protein [Candidatus Dormibacteraeota bacterium]